MPPVFHQDDIAIVGYGCVFPDAADPQAFWRRVLAGESSIGRVPEDRWPESLYLDETNTTEDKTYSSFGAYVSAVEVKRLAALHGLDLKTNNRLQIFLMEAAHQSLRDLPRERRRQWKAGWYLGCLGPDDQFSTHKFLLEEDRLKAHVATLKEPLRGQAGKILDETLARLKGERPDALALVVTTTALELLQKRFEMPGEHCLVDAACASSLAAVDVAIQKLRARECDIAMTGGVETELPPEQFALFSRLGLMSRGQGLPFDDRTDGVNQGEGAAVFAMMRLEDALREKCKVHAVVRGCGGSSNGRGSSLFSPTSEGQRLALERAYGDDKPERLDYLECHATGTRLGDATEIETVDAFFSGASRPIPIGSVKALIGHTKGAAGAAGLLKILLALSHRTAPPSPYFKGYIDGKKPKSVFVNATPEPMAADGPLHAGLSSAGFGGTNYHLHLETFDGAERFLPRPPTTRGALAVLAVSYVPREDHLEFFPAYGFKIPPNHLAQIDPSQRVALMAVSEALDRTGLDWDQIPRDRISVISSSCLGLDAWLSCRVRHFEFARGRDDADPAVQALIHHRHCYPKITEDAGPGTLNNVIAGRVANQFDFHGPNFHVDSDLSSFACALGIARLALWQKTSDFVVAIGVEDTIDDNARDVVKGGVHCLVLGRPGEAREPLFTVEEVEFQL